MLKFKQFERKSEEKFLMFKIGAIFCYSLNGLLGGEHNSEASNLFIIKNTHGEVLILVKLQAAGWSLQLYEN